jgi:hypothetical protein
MSDKPKAGEEVWVRAVVKASSVPSNWNQPDEVLVAFSNAPQWCHGVPIEDVLPASALAAPQPENRELLLKFGFQWVLCAFDGKHYLYCKECEFYADGHEHKEVTPELVQHKEGCKLAAALSKGA